MKRLICIFFVLLVVTSCEKTSESPMVSFYYWKTVFKLTTFEKQILKENKVSRIYIRYFDVDVHSKTSQPYPLSPVLFQDVLQDIEVVPVVYIKNNVFALKDIDLEETAHNIYDYIDQINRKNGFISKEIQIDCDWTLQTRDVYLKFIEIFKGISDKQLSATIRLHQVKYYKKTKIPDVDRGVLMYYNMGKIAPDSLNSIYDRRIAESYIESLKTYPLPLDIALPVYSWAIHIRDNKVIDLISKTDVADFQKDTNFVETGKHFFKVKNNTIRSGKYFKTNDVFKIETITKQDLLEMGSDLKKHLKETPKEIIFYDLDTFNFKEYNNDKSFFQKVISHF